MGGIVPVTKKGDAMHMNSWQNLHGRRGNCLLWVCRVYCDAAFCGVVKSQIVWVSS